MDLAPLDAKIEMVKFAIADLKVMTDEDFETYFTDKIQVNGGAQYLDYLDQFDIEETDRTSVLNEMKNILLILLTIRWSFS